MVFVAIFNDFSEAFDRICHDLLITKLHVHGLPFPVLKLMEDYLHNRK